MQDTRPGVIMDVSFTDRGRARIFAEACLASFNIQPAVYRTKVFLVLRSFEHRSRALRLIRRLDGRLLDGA